jgi:hypothetical protein
VKILLHFSTSCLCEQAFSCTTSTKSKGIIRMLSVEGNCEYVGQKFGQEFNICAKMNKLKYHIKSKLYSDFGCQRHFDV